MLRNYLPATLILACLTLLVSSFSYFSAKKLALSTNDTILPPAVIALDHKGQSVLHINGVISFTTGLDNDYYLADSNNRSGSFYIEAKIGKFINTNAERLPLNISIVIDRSGSMSGVKIGYAKKAAKQIVAQLQPEDFVSIVMYDNAVDSIQEPIAAKDTKAIMAKIDAIAPRGGTNLWGGTEKGYQYVQRFYKPGFINRVLLISDGLANLGITDPKIIKQKVQQYKDASGITISTFGVGLDYNETLMTDMAETGLGNYYFINHPDEILPMFNKELNGLMNIAAQDAVIHFKIPEGITITDAYPLHYSENGHELIFSLKDLFSEDTKAVLIKFKIKDGVKAPLLFQTSLNYTDVRTKSGMTINNVNLLSPIKDRNQYLVYFNRQVMEQTVLFTANQNLELAASRAEAGDYEGAMKDLNKAGSYLQSNKIYIDADGELEATDSLTRAYFSQVANYRTMQADSIKVLQKKTKSANYKLRTKKQ